MAGQLDAAGIAETDRVLDVGCGTGASTLAAARRVPGGKAAGVDSLDVLELARFELTPLADGGTAAELTFAVSEVA